MGINSPQPFSEAPTSPNLRHLFIALRGIDANPDAIASEDSPDWHELAPELASDPIQIDLMTISLSGASCASSLTRKVIVRAEEYRRIRLRLVSDQPAAADPLPKHNECGSRSFNCVVDTSGYTHALALKDGERSLLISSDHIADGFFSVLPDTETRLSIVFDPYSSLATSVGDAVEVSPVLSAETARGCTPSSSSP